MDEYFIYKGVDSRDLGVVIAPEDMPPLQKSTEEKELIEVPGRDGYLTISKDRKKTSEKRLTGILIDEANKDTLYNLLDGTGHLTLSNDPDVYYRAQVVETPEYEYHWTDGWIFSVEFFCQPYGYLESGKEPIEITTKDTTITNEYSDSEPLITVYGQGKVDLFVNSDKLILDIDGHITIDTELMESYKIDTVVPYQGVFPKLVTGDNTFTWDGNITKIEVIPRWRK